VFGENTLNSKISFQMEDKVRSNRLQEAKIQSKRMNMVNLEHKKAFNTEMHDTMDQQKILIKAARQDNYEKLCHMGH